MNGAMRDETLLRVTVPIMFVQVTFTHQKIKFVQAMSSTRAMFFLNFIMELHHLRSISDAYACDPKSQKLKLYNNVS